MSWIEDVRAELRRCTSCGLCLSACPTFDLRRAEGDSPRGRVHLIGDALLAPPDRTAAAHLAGCLECGACHDVCPTGVRVAVAQRAHRGATRRHDPAAFDRHVATPHAELAADPGAGLSVRAARDLLDGEAPPGSLPPLVARGWLLPVAGPMLRRAAPDLVARAVARMCASGSSIVDDPGLSADLERASGLLHDLGLCAEHEAALSRVEAAMRAHGTLTVVALDASVLRLRDQPLPDGLRVVAAHELFLLETGAIPDDAVQDVSLGRTALPELTRFGTTPATHLAAAAPVLLAAPALDALRRLVIDQRAWLAGRPLITTDARALVRFPHVVHVTALLGDRLRTERTP